MLMETSTETLRVQIQGDATLPTLIYLPGLHGDWTLNGSLREELAGKVRFVELAYPVHDGWKLADYGENLERELLRLGIQEGWLLAESFGSQVGWEMVAREERGRATGAARFQAKGMILAGGFVRYPLMWGVRLVRNSHRSLPL
jgi:pimeloyl-ACP methyl ester carboxylesterase